MIGYNTLTHLEAHFQMVQQSILLKRLDKEVHIWSVIPESVRAHHILDSCLLTLSKTEQQQYGRFRSAEDRHCYLISHALVRQALSKYADIHPSEWVFQNSPKGRPEISNAGVPPIRFNLTHTDGFTACVISLGGLCGIDAERINSRHNMVAIAKRMFSAEEYKQIQSLEGDCQLDYFFSRWTLREAYVKAVGVGISFPTRKLAFNVIAGNDIRIAFEPDIADSPTNWRFELFRPTEFHVAAIALGGLQQRNKEILNQTLGFE